MTVAAVRRALSDDDLRQRDRALAELCVVPHLMFLMAEAVEKNGFELRQDVKINLNRAAAAPLVRVDQIGVSRIARMTDDLARQLLHDLSPDDPRHGLYVCAMLALTLVDEGVFQDPQNMAVLAALVLIEDLREENGDSQWPYQETRLKKEAHALLVRANLMGYFHHPATIIDHGAN